MNLDDLKRALRYCPESGAFYWLESACKRMKRGLRAGTPHGNGYRRINVLGCRVFEHRLAWFYMTGEWPPHDIDHINGTRDDNRWSNLRAVTRSENNLNLRGAPKGHNRTGVLGVCKTKSNTYFARIKVDGREMYLGSFASAEEAGAAYKAALANVMAQR